MYLYITVHNQSHLKSDKRPNESNMQDLKYKIKTERVQIIHWGVWTKLKRKVLGNCSEIFWWDGYFKINELRPLFSVWP